ncbi:hypothetical protein GA0070616_2097 [Micromonospora nigra]|uniref:Uncharacterized protein n=1 Tax=Micromonospora nigra TaxID=145857 RepID=A0A1C6RUG3_9ACTN|nr:protealysin inhibitor emfourin [Micromonospora nigra]SCL20805.1 hypothetical protein GA0070616_2097 [Micromonospora nigra]
MGATVPASTTAASTPTPEVPTPTPTSGTPLVVLSRSGGIAGRGDTVTVHPDGRWIAVDRAGTTRTGTLDAAELDRLRRLVADPELAAEATRSPGPTACRDAFDYRLTVGRTESHWSDCPVDSYRPRVTAEVVELLVRATG